MLVDLVFLVAELVCSGSLGNLQMLSKLCCTGCCISCYGDMLLAAGPFRSYLCLAAESGYSCLFQVAEPSCSCKVALVTQYWLLTYFAILLTTGC